VISVWKQQAIERSHRLDLAAQDDKERYNLVSDVDEHLTGPRSNAVDRARRFVISAAT
jgi:hypothetical protein